MKYTERNIYVKKRIRIFINLKIIIHFIFSMILTYSISLQADLEEMQEKYSSRNINGIKISNEKIAEIYTIFQTTGNPFEDLINDIKDPTKTYMVIRNCDPYYQKPYNYICRQPFSGRIKLSILGSQIVRYEIQINLEEVLDGMGAFKDFGTSSELRQLVLELFQDNLKSYATPSLQISFSKWNLIIREKL